MKYSRLSAKLAAMLARLHTFSLLGIDALPVDVEVDVSPDVLPTTCRKPARFWPRDVLASNLGLRLSKAAIVL
jgi:hypothetical protein